MTHVKYIVAQRANRNSLNRPSNCHSTVLPRDSADFQIENQCIGSKAISPDKSYIKCETARSKLMKATRLTQKTGSIKEDWIFPIKGYGDDYGCEGYSPCDTA
jgi:hypothetical protein